MDKNMKPTQYLRKIKKSLRSLAKRDPGHTLRAPNNRPEKLTKLEFDAMKLAAKHGLEAFFDDRQGLLFRLAP